MDGREGGDGWVGWWGSHAQELVKCKIAGDKLHTKGKESLLYRHYYALLCES